MRKRHDQELYKRKYFNSQHMKMCPILSSHQKTQYHFTITTFAKIISLTLPSVGKDVYQWHSYTHMMGA